MRDKKNIPFALDFAIELPKNVVIESSAQGQDSTTVGPAPHSDDD